MEDEIDRPKNRLLVETVLVRMTGGLKAALDAKATAAGVTTPNFLRRLAARECGLTSEHDSRVKRSRRTREQINKESEKLDQLTRCIADFELRLTNIAEISHNAYPIEPSKTRDLKAILEKTLAELQIITKQFAPSIKKTLAKSKQRN